MATILETVDGGTTEVTVDDLEAALLASPIGDDEEAETQPAPTLMLAGTTAATSFSYATAERDTEAAAAAAAASSSMTAPESDIRAGPKPESETVPKPETGTRSRIDTGSGPKAETGTAFMTDTIGADESETVPYVPYETLPAEETLPATPRQHHTAGPGLAETPPMGSAQQPSPEADDLGAPSPTRPSLTRDGPTATAETSPSPMRLPASAQKQPPPNHGSSFLDESRYVRDEKGNLLHKWKVDYATRGGGGRAMCRDLDCLERHEQAGVRSIEKGALRIGRRILMEQQGDNQITIMWYHARCMFNTFTRSRKTTRVIESTDDLDGFEALKPEDQEMLRRIITGHEDLRQARFGLGTDFGGQKRVIDEMFPEPAAKRVKEEEKHTVRVGDRVWTYCRVRTETAAGPLVAQKSPKPELGMVVEDPTADGNVIIQFESAEHEKVRIERYTLRKFKRLKGWLRYPRVFEGKKQRLPMNWIQWKRPPPKLCGCNKQEWQHDCFDAKTGDYMCSTCTRGNMKNKVFGVGQVS